MTAAMRVAILVGALVFVALFVVTTFVPSAQARAEAEKYFSPKEIEQGLQFSFQWRLIFWTSTCLHLASLSLIVFTGFARTLAHAGYSCTGGRWLLTVLFVGAFCFLVDEAISLPAGLARLENLRAWGMTRRSLADWLAYRALGAGLAAISGSVILVGLYLLLRFLPRSGWALATVGGMVLGIGYAFILPVLISPLFNTFTPLGQTEWAWMKQPVETLARQAKVPVQEVLVVDASRQSSHTNAYFTGFGPSRRIVLYDTLLQAHTRLSPRMTARVTGLLGAPETGPLLAASLLAAKKTLGQQEMESILAHEMGHWQHDHIVKGIGLATVGAFVGLYLLWRILRRAVGRPPFLLTSPADPGGVPLVLLLFTLGLWLVKPVENAVSRHFERQADMASVDLTGRPDVFIEAEKRLVRTNISNVAANPFSVWLFNTHPTSVEQIHMAEQWRKDHWKKD